MGLFGRRAPRALTITADVYQSVHELLVGKVPSLASTVTPYGVLLLVLPDTALMLNYSGPRWSVAVMDVSEFPQMTTPSAADTPYAGAQVAELVVDVLERCAGMYDEALAIPVVADDSDRREWFTDRRAEVLAALGQS